jgi:membrane protein
MGKMKTLIERITCYWKFITNDIWRITDNEVTNLKYTIYTVIKTVYLTVERFIKDNIMDRASALTYSTLLAIVPILAILFAIARGFGFANLVEHQFHDVFGGVNDTTETILQFVDSYLAQAKSGMFIGIGLVMLLWTILNLTSNIEYAFNTIWQVNKPRSMYRKITDYFSMFLLLPILIVISVGLNIFMTTFLKGMENYMMLAPFLKFLVRLIPFAFTWGMFTALYIFMPNTKVKFKPALVAGILAGTVFQFFQILYISSQLWVTKYNAIYGSFAAIPLLLLWLQMSWTICLFGVELSYACQNVHTFSFDKDTRNISRRYRDFVTILILSLITKRFGNNEKPYTAGKLSETYRIPINLTNKVLFRLQEIGLIHEVMTDEKNDDITYQPSMDPNQLTLAVLLERLDCHGSENFKVDRENEFLDEWETIIKIKDEYYRKAGAVLLKDL